MEKESASRESHAQPRPNLRIVVTDERGTNSARPTPVAGNAPLPEPVAIARAVAEDRAHASSKAEDALAVAREAAADGHIDHVVLSSGDEHAEFGRGTDVYYVNGIATTVDMQKGDAAAYAVEIHRSVDTIHASTRGIVGDLATCALEKSDPAAAYDLAPERTVARVLESHVKGEPGHERFDGNVHFAAHSRGALIVQRGIESFELGFRAKGWSDERIQSTLSGHLSVETFGGASTTVAPYVTAVHYVNTHDGVAAGFGVAPESLHTSGEIWRLGDGPLAVAAESRQLAKSPTVSPNGEIVATRGHGAADPYHDLIENHAVGPYIAGRSNFPKTVAEWEKEHRQPSGPSAPNPAPGAAPTRDAVQARVDALREGGSRLPDVRELVPFANHAQTGSFVHVDRRHVAQHCGAGRYQLRDVDRDLGGVRPVEGQPIDRGPNGRIVDHAREHDVPHLGR